jgi:hypothetical protein
VGFIAQENNIRVRVQCMRCGGKQEHEEIGNLREKILFQFHIEFCNMDLKLAHEHEEVCVMRWDLAHNARA